MSASGVPRVVHSLPGRVRLRCDGDGGLQAHALAARLGAHPAVRRVTVLPSIGSITVHFDPACDFQDVLGSLPAVPPTPALPRVAAGSDGVARSIEIDWARVLVSCLVALLPLSPLGNVAIALLTSVIEQRWEASGGQRRLVPATC